LGLSDISEIGRGHMTIPPKKKMKKKKMKKKKKIWKQYISFLASKQLAHKLTDISSPVRSDCMLLLIY
jgi:hypothetical protein